VELAHLGAGMNRKTTMNKGRWIISAALLATAPLPVVAQTAPPAAQQAPADWRETYAYTVGMQAVIYGFPVVKNLAARHGMIEKPIGQADMPLNTWFHSRRASDATDKLHSSVTPDLLYSAAWFDVRKEPVVLTVPASPDLYYSVQFMEMYSDIFAYLGTRATGGKAGKHLLVGHDWQGEKPAGIESVIRAPNATGLLLLRTAILDRKALTASHKVQDGAAITPLSKWLRGDTSPETERDVIDPAPPTQRAALLRQPQSRHDGESATRQGCSICGDDGERRSGAGAVIRLFGA
jgi:hypothetical protein